MVLGEFVDRIAGYLRDAIKELMRRPECAVETPSTWVVGRVRPARHYGSVDIFLEALENASPGEVLVMDNSGR